MNTTYAVALLVCAVVSAVDAVVSWRRRPAPGATGMALFSVAMLVWAFAAATSVSWTAMSITEHGYWLLLAYVSILALPIAMMVMVLEYTRGSLPKPFILGLLAVEPIVMAAVLAADSSPGGFFGGSLLSTTVGQWGSWFWVNSVYWFVLTVVAALLLARDLPRVQRIHRLQRWTMMAALVIPPVATILIGAGLSPVPDIDLTPLALTVTGLLFGLALLRLNLFQVVPVARDQLIEEMRDGVVVFDSTDRILDINPAALLMMGLTTDCVGANAHEVLSMWTDAAVALQAGAPNVEIEISGSGDQLRSVEVSASAVAVQRGDERLATLLTLRDVTERVRAQRDLAESEQHLARVVEGADLGTWDWDLVTDEVAFNDRWFHMLGYETTELPHNLSTWELLIHPDDLDMTLAAVQAHVDGETSSYECPHRLRAKSGEWRWILDRGRVVSFSDEGRPLRMSGTHLDITERVRAEQALRHSEKLLTGLAQATQHLLADASLADADISEALRCLGEAAGVDRVYVFEHEGGEGRGSCSQRFEWSSDGARAQIDNPDLQHVPWDDVAPRWHDTFTAGGYIAGDVADFPAEERVSLDPQGVLSILVLPIWSSGRLWGFIGFDACASTRAWEPSEVALLRATANSLGAAIERQRLVASEHEQRVFAEGLRDAAAAVNSTLDFDGVLDRIFESLMKVVECDSANVMLYDASDDIAHMVRSVGYAERCGQQAARRISTQYLSENKLLQRMLKTRLPVAVRDVTAEPEWTSERGMDWVRSYAAAPIFARDELVGFLNIESASVGRFQGKHAVQMRALADQAAAAIANARLAERLKQLAITDALTGVFNRHGLTQIAEREIFRARRSGRPVAVAVVDVDHFKIVNDRYGHTVGDKVLTAVAECCQENVRSLDVVARLGGDEFVLFLPDTDGEHARVVAERIRERVESDPPLCYSGDARVGVSVCIGIAAQAGPGVDLDALLTAADHALYAAKEAGRNRVVLA